MGNATELRPFAQRPNGRSAQHPPCPRWCTLAGAHPFAAAGFRIHTRRVGAWLAVQQVEAFEHTYSPAIYVDDDVELSPEQVEAFAADLSVAAGILRGAR